MARRLLTKENPGLFQAKSRSSGRGARVYLVVYLYFLWVVERTHVTDHLIGAGRKTPNWPVKMTYLGEAEMAVGSSIKSRFGVIVLAQVIPFWACGFDTVTYPVSDIAGTFWIRKSLGLLTGLSLILGP